MKNQILNEVKKELKEDEMKKVLDNICKYFNKDMKLIEDIKNNIKHRKVWHTFWHTKQ